MDAKGEGLGMKGDPQDCRKADVMDKWYALIIMFLIAALIFILLMLMSAAKALALDMVPIRVASIDATMSTGGCSS
jgi:hypothetical protein